MEHNPKTVLQIIKTSCESSDTNKNEEKKSQFEEPKQKQTEEWQAVGKKTNAVDFHI